MIIDICLLTGKIYKFISNNKNFNFPSQFCLGSISNNFDYVEPQEVSLKGNVHDFSVNYYAINKSDILNSHKHLTIRWMYG